MNELLHNDNAVAVLIVGSCLVFALVVIVAAIALKIVKANNETKLNQEMLARGMSAEEIKAVLDAGSEK